MRPDDRALVRLLGGLALTWFLTLSYGMPWLWSTPRYQLVTAAAAAMILALWWRRHLLAGAPLMAAGLAAVLLGSNLGLIYLDNRDPLFGERALVAFSEGTAETIYTDPATRRTALFLLEAAGTAERVVAAPSPPGALFVGNPHPHRPIPGEELQRFQPQPGWQVVATAAPDRKLSAVLFHRLGLRAWLPRGIADKFDPPQAAVTLYRVP